MHPTVLIFMRSPVMLGVCDSHEVPPPVMASRMRYDESLPCPMDGRLNIPTVHCRDVKPLPSKSMHFISSSM